jgi:transcription elongation factor GreA
MSAAVNFLTPEGKRKLEKELDFLRTVKRPQIAAYLRSAIQDGDLTDNAGYEEAKREQAFVEGRIQRVEATLANARILEELDQRDEVSLGARVTVREEGRESPETYRIVGSAEADPAGGRISHESPLGRALLGRAVGNTVRVLTPGGQTRFEILAIE